MVSMIVDTLRAIRYGMGNPLSRAILKTGMKRSADSVSKIDVALEAFAFGTVPKNFGDWAYTKMLQMVSNVICWIFSLEPRDLAKYFQDPVTRRGVASVVTDIATCGVARPQRLNSPFLVVWNPTNMCNLRCKHLLTAGWACLEG